MLYSRVARQHWFMAISESQRSFAPENLRWAGVVYNGIPMDRYPFRTDKDDFLFFLGRADEEKAELLGWAAALLFPIQWPEPFGLVMTEAMACGTPVIALRNGSVPEVVADGETGLVVDSVEEMATAVDRVGGLDPQVIRARVEERFSAEAMVAGYERAYERALAGERAGFG